MEQDDIIAQSLIKCVFDIVMQCVFFFFVECTIDVDSFYCGSW
jgi:hypothetical protein